MKDFEGVRDVVDFAAILDDLETAFVHEAFGFGEVGNRDYSEVRYRNVLDFNNALEELSAKYNKANQYAYECRNEMIRTRRELEELKAKLREITGSSASDADSKE